MQTEQNNIKSILIKIASPQVISTGFVLPQYNLIITALKNIYGNKQVLISGKRFPRTLAKVLFTDPINNIACIEVPAGVLFPKIKTGDTGKLHEDETVLAMNCLFADDFNLYNAKVLKAGKKDNYLKLITSNLKCEKVIPGTALLNEQLELLGMIVNRADNEICTALPLNTILKSIDEYSTSGINRATRCNGCKNILSINELKNSACPNCQTPIDEYLIKEKKHEPVPTAKKLEEIIKKLNYETAISRVGMNYWEIEEGSALIRIAFDDKSRYIKANAVLCKLPDEEKHNIYEYLLMENNYLKGLSFSIQQGNIVLAMMQIHETDLHIKTAVKLFKYLFYKADDYDDTLIEMGAVPLQDE